MLYLWKQIKLTVTAPKLHCELCSHFMHSLYVMCVNLHESQSKCPWRGVGAPKCVRFSSVCFMGSQLNLCKSFTKCPRRGLDLEGLYPKLDLKPRGMQQCFVWLFLWKVLAPCQCWMSAVKVWGDSASHTMHCLVPSHLFNTLAFIFSLSGPWWFLRKHKVRFCSWFGK